MRATQQLLARGFMGRSMDEFKRLSQIALKLEAVKGPSGPRALYEFSDRDSVDECIVMSDQLIGGSSSSNFEHVVAPGDANSIPPSYSRFHGHISTSLPSGRPNIQRTGYAAFRTPDMGRTVFGRSVWDIDPYSYLAMRIKSDGRAYFVNLQAETIEPTDIHQHRLFSKRPGQWETVLIKWNDFVRTNHGFLVEPQAELMRQRVTSFGIGLTDRVEGPFELCIEKIWATNHKFEADTVVEGAGVLESKEDTDAPEPLKQGKLRTRKGEKIQW